MSELNRFHRSLMRPISGGIVQMNDLTRGPFWNGLDFVSTSLLDYNATQQVTSSQIVTAHEVGKVSHTLTIELSDRAYTSLKDVAAEIGETPERLVMHWIEKHVDPPFNDPLLALAGVFESTENDIGDRHDAYIGAALMDDNS